MIDPIQRVRSLDLSPARGLAAALVAPIEEVLRGKPAERVLDQLLRTHRGWSSAERATAAELVFGVALWRLRLAEQPDRVPGAAMLGLYLRDLAGWSEDEALRATGSTSLPPAREPASLSERYSMPPWLLELLTREVADVEPLLAALDVPGPISLRANLLRCTREQLIAELREQGVEPSASPFSLTGVQVARRFNVYGSRAFREGRFELQDEGSQLLGQLVHARPGETVLDFCAGAGGKTLLLAAALENRGTLWAHDVDPERLDRLSVRAARAGAQVRVLRAMPEELRVDAVLVDAPCSEVGALRRGPDLRFRLRPEDVAAFPELQQRILAQAARHVRPGGRLVYATCTWNRAENEEVVEELLAREPTFEIAELPEWAAPFRAGKYFKSFPHRHGTDGFFAAVLERRS